MKKSTLAILLGVSLGLGGMTAASAQTCDTPASGASLQEGNAISGNTCDGVDSVALYCGSLDSSGGKKDIVYRIHLAAEGSADRTATSLTIGGGGAGFTPSAFLYTAGCNTGDGCVQTGDPDSAVPLAGLAEGDYWLAISAGPAEGATACGAFTVTPNGTLPVELKSFSVM